MNWLAEIDRIGTDHAAAARRTMDKLDEIDRRAQEAVNGIRDRVHAEQRARDRAEQAAPAESRPRMTEPVQWPTWEEPATRPLPRRKGDIPVVGPSDWDDYAEEMPKSWLV